MPAISERQVVELTDQAPAQLGDLLIEYLHQLHVQYVFGVPGGAIEPLYNALARSERARGPRAVVARHETGAAFMADGYARNSGNLGVCCATTGPGATNLITGVASAYENNIPMLVITAQTALASFGMGAVQDSADTGINTVGMFQYCTRYNSMVSHTNQFERKLCAAIMTACQSPAGPAHLSFPLDVLQHRAPVATPSYDLATLLWQPSLVDDQAVNILCNEVKEARKPVFVIGDHCGEALGTILDVALLLGASILTTPHGKGLVSPYHPLFRGVIGFAGHQSAAELMSDPEVDMVLAMGTALSEWVNNGWDTAFLSDRLIHVEATESHLTRSPMAKLHVRGRLTTIFDRVLAYLQSHSVSLDQPDMSPDVQPPRAVSGDNGKRSGRHFRLDEEDKYYDDSTPIKPQRLMRELPNLFPPNTRYLADNGNSMVWSIHYLHPYDRRIAGRRDALGGVFRVCLEFASMGWAIGSAVGAALGSHGNPVVCITGDGSMLMAGQELTVAVLEELPVIFVVLNDAALGMVKHGQRLGHAEPTAFGLPAIDYQALAAALGAAAHTVHSPEELLGLDFNAMCQRRGPTLLDVHIDPEEVPPMGNRTRVLQSASKPVT